MTKIEFLKSFAIVVALILLTTLCACSNKVQNNLLQTETPEASPDVLSTPTPKANNIEQGVDNAIPKGDNTVPGTACFISGVIITFDYQIQPGVASNQFAIWIEDMNGQHIKTLYATYFTANGGYKGRPDSLALWVEKSGLASMAKAEVDAITSATPLAEDLPSGWHYSEIDTITKNLSYTWDLTDVNGNVVLPGEYKFFVEGTLRWKNSVVYSGVIMVGDAPVTVSAAAKFIYEALEWREPFSEALTSAAVENSMISAVKAIFIPNTIE
jgi:hypothetical protein